MLLQRKQQLQTLPRIFLKAADVYVKSQRLIPDPLQLRQGRAGSAEDAGHILPEQGGHAQPHPSVLARKESSESTGQVMVQGLTALLLVLLSRQTCPAAKRGSLGARSRRSLLKR